MILYHVCVITHTCVSFLLKERRGKCRGAHDKRKWTAEIKDLKKELRTREEVYTTFCFLLLLLLLLF